MGKKRLLVITNSFPDRDDKHIGGIFVKEQVRCLAPHFEEVHVVFPSTFGLGHKPKEDFVDYSFDNVHVHFLGYFNVPLFLRVFRGGFTYLMAKALARLVRREGIRFDVVHAHFTWPSGAAAARLKAEHGVPLVVTEHTSLTLDRAVEAKDPQFVDTWLASDAVIRVREGDLDRIASLGVPREKLHFIPNGFDGSRFRPMDKVVCRERLGLPTGGRLLVSVGVLEEVKGHRFLIDAMRAVHGKDQSVVCVIVGGGPLMPVLQAQVDSLGLAGTVRLVGAKPHGEMPLWLGASDMVVHPSLSEGNPVVMFEAMGCGRPFIGTRVGGVPEVVTSEDLGLLCAPGDSADLAGSIIRGLSRGWDAGRISSHASRYSWQNVSEQILSVLNEAMGG